MGINSNLQGFLPASASAPATAAIFGNAQNAVSIVELVAGEIIELWVYQNSGVALNLVQNSVSPNLWVKKLI